METQSESQKILELQHRIEALEFALLFYASTDRLPVWMISRPHDARNPFIYTEQKT